MINRIDYIKNLGLVFSDYKREAQLPLFRRFNLLYGWNGTGKTTLSQLFQAITGEQINGQTNLKYQFVDSQSRVYQENTPYSVPIKVFNKQYIQNKIEFLKGSANSLLLIVGEENKTALEQIRKDEIDLFGQPGNEKNRGMKARLIELKKDLENTNKERGNRFTQIASTIGAAMVGRAYRTYRKPDAERDFKTLQSNQKLTKRELESHSIALKQDLLPEIGLLELPISPIDEGGVLSFTEKISGVCEKIDKALLRTTDAELIDRLKQHSDISSWVETGLKLHETHKSTECEYCRQKLPDERIKLLKKHFNDEDQRLKQELDSLIREINNIKTSLESLKFPNKAQFYKELQSDYVVLEKDAIQTKEKVDAELDTLTSILADKKAKTSESLQSQSEVSITELENYISKCNNIIEKHNEKSNNLENIKQSAEEKIKNHWLSSIMDDVTSDDERISELSNQIDILENGDDVDSDIMGIKKIEERIKLNRRKISSTAKACEKLNEGLQAFLGHDEIQFEPAKQVVDSNDIDGTSKEAGLRIMRGGSPATILSEGEKTAIAFVYFTIDLQGPGFSVMKGIILLDDPISSLDIDLLYRTCTYIEKRLNSAKQLFIFTHNYDFFNLIKKWLINEFPPDKVQEEPQTELFMIENKFDSGKKQRVAILSPLDPLLKDFESEYHYLFKKLLDFDKDNPESEGTRIAAIYNYPNLARKMLECFLAFRVPIKGSFFVRLQGLKKIEKSISSEDIGLVYTFVNSHSHLDTKNGLLQFDPKLTQSGRQCIALVLHLIELADPKHFKAMKKAVSTSVV